MNRRQMILAAVAAVVAGPSAVAAAGKTAAPTGGITVPFATLPVNRYIKGPVYKVKMVYPSTAVFKQMRRVA